MTNAERQLLITNIERLTARIDSYRRISIKQYNIASHYAECGYRESAQFRKGQAFALGYVEYDLQIILDSLNDLLTLEVPANE